MKALTVCQPYANLIVESPVLKRVENRSWATPYRGLVAIHAGKSKSWLKGYEGRWPRDLPYGAVVGVATIADCVAFNGLDRLPEAVEMRWPWLADHYHASGPWCWILEDARQFREPIPATGALGFWPWEPPADWESLLIGSEGKACETS